MNDNDEQASPSTGLADIERVAGIGSWRWDIAADTVEWSEELVWIFGLESAEGLSYEDYIERIPEGDRDRVNGIIEGAMKEADSFAFQHQIRLGDGSLRSLSCRGEVRRNADGAPLGMIGTAQDVTALETSERRLQEAQRIARIGSWEWDGAEGKVRGTAALFDIFGVAGDGTLELSSEALLALLPAEDREHLRKQAGIAAAGGGSYSIRHRIIRPDGSERIVRSIGEVADEVDGEVSLMRGTIQDVTEIVEQESEIGALSERNRVILEAAAEGIVGLDESGKISFANPEAARLLRRDEGELEGEDWRDALFAATGNDASPLRRALRSPIERSEDEETFVRSPGGTFPVQYTLAPVSHDAAPLVAVLTFRDISEQRRYEARLRQLADRDPLTGLFNRRRFERELEDHLERAARNPSAGVILFMDLDEFKDVNDALGHRAGDEVLRAVARTLDQRTRRTDVLARVGGDEFALLMPATSVEAGVELARELLRQLREREVIVAGRRLRVTASAGVAHYFDGATTAERLMVEADQAMYEAKQVGRDRVEVHERRDESTADRRIDFSERIRDALSEGRFVLWGQPIFDLETDEIFQYEVLLRMRRPDGTLVAPGGFIGPAERYGLIGEIDRWVVDSAIELLAAGRSGTRPLTINISGRSLADRDLHTYIAQRVEGAGFDPALLVVEVTETAAIHNIAEVREFSHALGRLGCKVALDDFGAGFGSFYYLKHLPFDYLKIDGDFIRQLAHNETDKLVVRSVVQLASGLGKKTIAEFVGDEATKRLLRRYGVDYGQGFGLARPAPLAELLDAV